MPDNGKRRKFLPKAGWKELKSGVQRSMVLEPPPDIGESHRLDLALNAIESPLDSVPDLFDREEGASPLDRIAEEDLFVPPSIDLPTSQIPDLPPLPSDIGIRERTPPIAHLIEDDESLQENCEMGAASETVSLMDVVESVKGLTEQMTSLAASVQTLINLYAQQKESGGDTLGPGSVTAPLRLVIKHDDGTESVVTEG